MRTFRLPLMLAAVCFVAVLVVGYRLQARLTTTTPVLVAARDLEPHHRVTASDVRLVNVAPNLVPPGALRTPDAAVGQYTRDRLLAGDLIRPQHLSAQAPPLTIAEKIAPGMRALSIAVVPSQVQGGALRPGDAVDVIAAKPAKQKDEHPTVTALLHSVPVLDVRNQQSMPARPAVAADTGDTTSGAFMGRTANATLGTMGDGTIPASVLLEVTPEDANQVIAAIAGGQTIYLTLVGHPAGEQP